MIKTSVYKFNPVKLIDEVKKRPGLYSTEQPADREDRLLLWKDIGAALYHDWDQFNKSTAYDRVLVLQRKWRSLRDAYNRELRLRKSGSRDNRRVYIYFKRMSFLGGYEGELSEEDENDAALIEAQKEEPLLKPKFKKPKKRKRKQSSSDSDQNGAPEETSVELPIFPMDIGDEGESDRLFLMSFVPEMRQLPVNIKMWARSQIANVMQEAVSCHYNNTAPLSDSLRIDIKQQIADNSD